MNKSKKKQPVGKKSKRQPARKFNRTDAGNGERFAAQHGDKIRYCRDWGKWLYYDGKRWSTQVGEQKARCLAVKTARSIVKEARGKDLEERGEILSWSCRSESAYGLEMMLRIAVFVVPIAAYSDQFDKDPWLLNCLNGTIDLRTGKLKPHDPRQMITKLCRVKYNPNAKLDLWEKFLQKITGNNPELIEFLQVAAGYSATGDTREEKLFLAYGPTATGKSTFLEAIKSALGEYAQTADFETFLKRGHVGGVRNDIARLDGTRLVISIEVDEGKRLAEGLIKMLTGGDTVAARFLYKESFEFVPQFKLWLAANHVPHVSDTDDAMWRRILRVPFEHTIPFKERNPKVKATLRNPKVAGPAILAWIVQGCLKWKKKGIVVPEIVKQSTKEYRCSQDPLSEFFNQQCVFGPDFFVRVSRLRAAYEEWSEENGEDYPLTARDFNSRLRSRGCVDKPKKTNGKVERCWHGIELKKNHHQTGGKNCGKG